VSYLPEAEGEEGEGGGAEEGGFGGLHGPEAVGGVDSGDVDQAESLSAVVE
jgi:hypothetical protein